jgi:hypothetical protein
MPLGIGVHIKSKVIRLSFVLVGSRYASRLGLLIAYRSDINHLGVKMSFFKTLNLVSFVSVSLIGVSSFAEKVMFAKTIDAEDSTEVAESTQDSVGAKIKESIAVEKLLRELAKHQALEIKEGVVIVRPSIIDNLRGQGVIVDGSYKTGAICD